MTPSEQTDALIAEISRLVTQQAEFRNEVTRLVISMLEKQRVLQLQIWLLFIAVGSIALIFLFAILAGPQ